MSPVAATEPHRWLAGVDSRRMWLVPGLLVLLCAALLTFSVQRLLDIERDLRISATENMLWVLTQTQVEGHRLLTAIADQRASATQRASTANPLADIERRHDLLLSRIQLLDSGPQRRYLAQIGHMELLDESIDTLRGFDPDATGIELHELPALAAATEIFTDRLHRAANDTMVYEWEGLAGEFEAFRQSVWQAIASVVGVFAGLLFLGWRMIAGQRALLRAEQLRRRSEALERELDRERSNAAYFRDFAAIISHQFRTPLAIIDSSVQRIDRQRHAPDADATHTRAKSIRQAIARLTRLVDTALLAGKLDHGQIDIRVQPQRIDSLIDAARQELLVEHPERRIEWEPPSRPVLVQADPALVSHILQILFDNAAKYSLADRPIRVRLLVTRTHCRVRIRDFGPGIAPEHLPRVFERFWRGAHGGRVAGTGLGLALARDLARRLDGDVTVSSVVGVGSAFDLQLPFEDVATTEDAITLAAPAARGGLA